MEKKTGLVCNLDTQQIGEECWKTIKRLGSEFKLEVNIEKMKNHMKHKKMGIITVKKNKLELTSDPSSHILPCIKEDGNRTTTTKWGVLSELYLKPHYNQVYKKFLNLKRQLFGERRRSKRSLVASILGLAGAQETQELRKALRTELSNQQVMGSNLAKMLRAQIQVAEKLEAEHKTLFQIKKEDEKLETTLQDITIYLESALANTSDANTENHHDISALMRFVTVSERLKNTDTILDTLLDIVHCPYSRCVGILDDVMARNNIGSSETYLMIAETMRTVYTQGKVKVIMKNITVQSDRTISMKCIPFKQGKDVVKLEYKGEISITKQGYFKTNADDCRQLHGQTMCSNIIWEKDECLDKLLKNQPLGDDDCKDHLISDNKTQQDFIFTNNTLEIFSRNHGDIKIQSGAVEFKSKLNPGTNVFKLGDRI